MNIYGPIEVRGTVPATPGYPDVVQAHLAAMHDHLTEHQDQMLGAALMLTDEDHRHLFRWHSPEISTGIDAGANFYSNELRLWAEQDPPTVWCEYPTPEPKEPTMATTPVDPADVRAAAQALGTELGASNPAGIDDLDNDWPEPGMRYGAPHNILGHTLLVLCPPLGEWIHNHTRPTVRRWFR